MTVGQAFRLTIVGTVIGLALSIALARVMESALLGIATGDARVFAVFAAVLMSAGAAGWLSPGPARGSDRSDDRAPLRITRAPRRKYDRLMAPVVIGVAGGSGSGKTTVVRKIVEALDDARVQGDRARSLLS